MNNEIQLRGIVTNSMPIGEYDRRISILTLERGRISAFIKGVKRPKGGSLLSVEPFCFGKFSLYQGSRSYTLKGADISDYFHDISMDIEKIYFGMYFLEVSDYYSGENTDEKERLKLLYHSLKTLATDSFDPYFLKMVFEYKTIALNGEYPNVFECLVCKKRETLSFFSIKNRGCMCEGCSDKESIRIQGATVYAMQSIFTKKSAKLFTFKVSDRIQKELSSVLNAYKKAYFTHVFKSEKFLDM